MNGRYESRSVVRDGGIFSVKQHRSKTGTLVVEYIMVVNIYIYMWRYYNRASGFKAPRLVRPFLPNFPVKFDPGERKKIKRDEHYSFLKTRLHRLLEYIHRYMNLYDFKNKTLGHKYKRLSGPSPLTPGSLTRSQPK